MDAVLDRSGWYQLFWSQVRLCGFIVHACMCVDVRQFSVVEDAIRSRSSLDGVCECVVEVAPSVMYEAGWRAGTGALVGSTCV